MGRSSFTIVCKIDLHLCFYIWKYMPSLLFLLKSFQISGESLSFSFGLIRKKYRFFCHQSKAGSQFSTYMIESIFIFCCVKKNQKQIQAIFPLLNDYMKITNRHLAHKTMCQNVYILFIWHHNIHRFTCYSYNKNFLRQACLYVFHLEVQYYTL